MGKIIEVRLSDAQYAALIAEAEACGHKLFEHCRAKLVASAAPMPAQPKPRPPVAAIIQPSADERFARLENAIAALTDHVLGQAAPVAEQEEQPNEPPDVDSIVNAQFAAAEAQGLTEPEPDQADIDMAHSGVRPLSRRPIPFSAANTPRHLQQLLG